MESIEEDKSMKKFIALIWNRKMRCAGEDHPEAGTEAHNCITEEISGRLVLDK